MRIDGVTFLTEALLYQGCPYIWGAKGPEQFDCSGLVTWCIQNCGGPRWRKTHNSQRLFDELPVAPAQGQPFPEGLLLFYGAPGHVVHVMISAMNGEAYGACGGGKQTLTPERGACVQFRSTVRYRPDFLGARLLPECVPSRGP